MTKRMIRAIGLFSIWIHAMLCIWIHAMLCIWIHAMLCIWIHAMICIWCNDMYMDTCNDMYMDTCKWREIESNLYLQNSISIKMCSRLSQIVISSVVSGAVSGIASAAATAAIEEVRRYMTGKEETGYQNEKTATVTEKPDSSNYGGSFENKK